MHCGSPATGPDQFLRFNPEFVPHGPQQEQNLAIDGEEAGAWSVAKRGLSKG
jgi:hypothetical protein